MKKTDKYKAIRVSSETYDMIHVFATTCEMPMSKVVQLCVKKEMEKPQPPKFATRQEQFDFIANQLFHLVSTNSETKDRQE